MVANPTMVPDLPALWTWLVPSVLAAALAGVLQGGLAGHIRPRRARTVKVRTIPTRGRPQTKAA
jgi:hypothetical protein